MTRHDDVLRIAFINHAHQHFKVGQRAVDRAIHPLKMQAQQILFQRIADAFVPTQAR